MIRLTDSEFTHIESMMKKRYGINLAGKRQLIESRLFSTLVQNNCPTFTEYFKKLDSDPEESISIVNKLTTNHTYFMREIQHYDFMKEVILPAHLKNNKKKSIRIWSAGCSSGEEAYTTVMLMKEFFGAAAPSWDTTILATDISEHVMSIALNKQYVQEDLKDLPPAWVQKHFTRTPDGLYNLSQAIKNDVVFKKFNLMDPFQYKAPFDLIFCRNVMIYFDQDTKNKLCNKYYDALNPGGYFFIGHSETVQRDHSKFEYIKPSIYQRGV